MLHLLLVVVTRDYYHYDLLMSHLQLLLDYHYDKVKVIDYDF